MEKGCCGADFRIRSIGVDLKSTALNKERKQIKKRQTSHPYELDGSRHTQNEDKWLSMFDSGWPVDEFQVYWRWKVT